MEHRVINYNNIEYSIQHNAYLDINIIMKPIDEGDNFYRFEFVDYIHGDLGKLAEIDILYYINQHEANNKKIECS